MLPSVGIKRFFAIAVAVAVVASSWLIAAQPTTTGLYGPIEKEVQSDYSHIQVRKKGNTRTLMFVRDSGEEVVETMVNLDRPFDMLIDYTRSMFLSYAHRPEQKKVLIVGLGGGSMIDFLQKYDPQLNIDVVEIDPAIIDVADKYFNIHAGEKLKIIKSDGLKYLADTSEKYDVIYMDAFLKPSADTDVNGVPLALKTDQFYKQVEQKLTPGGLMVFNLNPHSGSRDDIAGIAKAFPQTYVYKLARGEGFVVVGAITADRLTPAVITRQAADADRRFKASFSLENLSKTLQR